VREGAWQNITATSLLQYSVITFVSHVLYEWLILKGDCGPVQPFPVVTVIFTSTLGSNFKLHLALRGDLHKMTSKGPFPLQLVYDLIALGPDLVYLLANPFTPFYEKKKDLMELS